MISANLFPASYAILNVNMSEPFAILQHSVVPEKITLVLENTFATLLMLKYDANFLGLFFILPCIDDYTKIDLRTVTFDIPPQEVKIIDVFIVH